MSTRELEQLNSLMHQKLMEHNECPKMINNLQTQVKTSEQATKGNNVVAIL